jgi:hypothetical protein
MSLFSIKGDGNFRRESVLDEFQNMVRVKIGDEDCTMFFNDKEVFLTDGGLKGSACYTYGMKKEQKVLLEMLIRQELKMSEVEMEQYKNQGLLPC